MKKVKVQFSFYLLFGAVFLSAFFVLLNFSFVTAQGASLEDIQVRADREHERLTRDINDRVNKINSSYSNIPPVISEFEFQSLAGIDNINIPVSLTFESLTKSSFIDDKAQAAKDALDNWLAAVMAATDAVDAQLEYDRLADELKTRTVILPALKTAENFNKLYGKMANANEGYRNLINTITFFDTMEYFTPDQNYSWINPKYIKTVTTTVGMIYDDKIDPQVPNFTDVLFSVSFFDDLFNLIDGGNVAKIQNLKNKINEASSSLDSAYSIYRKSLGSIEKIFVQAAKDFIEPGSLPSPELDFMVEKYEKLYEKYQVEAKDFCFRVNKDADKKLDTLLRYTGKVNELTNPDFYLLDDLESMRVWREDYIEAQRALLLCATVPYGIVEDIERDIKKEFDDFISRAKISEKFNRSSIRSFDNLRDFINKFDSTFNIVRAMPAFNESEISSLDYFISQLKPEGTLLSDSFNDCVNNAGDGLKVKIIDPGVPINEVNDKYLACTDQFKAMKKDTSDVKNRWYDLLLVASERGEIIPDSLRDDVIVSRFFRKFGERRESYYQRTDRIIDRRREIVEYNRDQLDIRFGGIVVGDVSSENFVTLTGVYEILTAKANQLLVDSDGIAPNDGGLLELKKNEIKSTTDYSELIEAVRSIKDLNITNILVPIQKKLIKVIYYYQRHYILEAIAQSINADILGLDEEHPDKAQLLSYSSSILADLPISDGYIDSIVAIISDDNVTTEQIKEIKSIEGEIKAAMSSMNSRTRNLFNLYKEALEEVF